VYRPLSKRQLDKFFSYVAGIQVYGHKYRKGYIKYKGSDGKMQGVGSGLPAEAIAKAGHRAQGTEHRGQACQPAHETSAGETRLGGGIEIEPVFRRLRQECYFFAI